MASRLLSSFVLLLVAKSCTNDVLAKTAYTFSKTFAPAAKKTNGLMEGMYWIEAWACEPMYTETIDGRTLPKKLSPGSFSQGSPINVCFALNDAAYENKLRMKLLDFDWTRNDSEDDNDVVMTEQPAIRNGLQARNKMTHYKPDECESGNWCSFTTTTLHGDFYKETRKVYGNGKAILGYSDEAIQLGTMGHSAFAVFNIAIDVHPTGPWREINAYLCDPDHMEAVGDRILPKKVPRCHFGRGDQITMCVAVDNQSYEDGVVISKVCEFNWFDRETKFDKVSDSGVSQKALYKKYDPIDLRRNGCDGNDWCILTTDVNSAFYEREEAMNTVSGWGYASLEFRNETKVEGFESTVFSTSITVKANENGEKNTESDWFTTQLHECNDFYKYGDEVPPAYKYYSSTCENERFQFVKCRELCKDCDKCPPIDFDQFSDAFPASLAEKFVSTLALASLSSPDFCTSYQDNVCSDYEENKRSLSCCCEEDLKEWQDCLITKDFPDMLENVLDRSQPEPCVVDCATLESEQHRSAFLSNTIVLGGIIIPTVIAIFVLFFYLYRRMKANEDEWDDTWRAESNVAKGPEKNTDTHSSASDTNGGTLTESDTDGMASISHNIMLL